MRPVGLLLISALLASLGQILFKKGVLLVGNVTFESLVSLELWRLISNPSILLGLTLYALSTILWLIALSNTTLNFAYPFTSLTFVLVILASRLIFTETIPDLRYVGIAFIVFGILLASMA